MSVINLIPDYSVQYAPSGFAEAIAAAAAILEQTITDNITLNISYGWGTYDNQYDPNLAGALESLGGPVAGAYVSYTTLKGLLTAKADGDGDPAIVAALPLSATQFPNESNSFYVSSAQQKALGDFSGDPTAIDGSIGFGTAWTDPTDWVGAALHELTHAMGRTTSSYTYGYPTILDLYHYSAPGAFDWVGGTPSYFSIDGGLTPLADFSTVSDYADWTTGGLTPTDPDDWEITSNSLSWVDIKELEAIGFATNAGAPPTSDTITIKGAEANQAVVDDSTTTLFAGVDIEDPNPNQVETVTVALSNAANGILSNLGSGTYDPDSGVYTVIGSAAAVTASLQDLVFNPAIAEVAPGQTVTTTFGIAVTDSAGQSAFDDTTSVVAIASGAGNRHLSLKTAIENSGGSFSDNGLALIGGESTRWTGTATVTDTPSYDAWAAYSGTMAEEILTASSPIASDIPDAQFTNPALTAVGAPFAADGLAVWGDPGGNPADSAASGQIAYTFSSPLPANTPMMLWAPGGSFNGNTGPFIFTFSASLDGAAVSTSGWSFDVEGPFGTPPMAAYTPDPATGQVVISDFQETYFPDAVILVTPNTPIDSIEVSAATIPFDFWGLAFPAVNMISVPDDFYGSGTSDILWRNASSGIADIWQMNGTQVLNSAVIGGSPDWSVADTGDFNGDGKADILWQQSGSGLVVEWEMDDTQVLNSTVIGGSPDWSVAATGDFNGDGKADILWQNLSGGVVEWQMDGAQPSNMAFIGGSGDWKVVGTGDFNGDGKSDILWQQAGSGVVDEWQMSGSEVQGSAVIGGSPDWTIAATGDFNGDGNSDILWQQNGSGLVVEWQMNGTEVVNSAVIGGSPDWKVVDTGDFNGDGKSDILWQNSSGLVVDWHMNGTQVQSSAVIGGGGGWSVVPS